MASRDFTNALRTPAGLIANLFTAHGAAALLK